MQRKTHELVQGQDEWHQFRAHHHGASEASAMLGLSSYKSRTELLREKKTGLSKEFSQFVQERILDRGHVIETHVRQWAEHVIGEDLFPVTMSYGNLSASCDGLTFDETIAWECKQYNATDFEIVKNGGLPEKHWPQCQQVMLVTGAEKLLFTISDGTEEGTAHTWVDADAELQQRIIDGWDQFNRDLETFDPEPEYIEVKAEAVMALPALSINVGGSISIQSNLEKFGERLRSFIEETNAKPETDQDFANLEQACKVLKEAEEALKQAESNALAQTASVDEMRRTVSFMADMARNNRLTFEKLVKTEKENRKTIIVMTGKQDFQKHIKAVQADVPVQLLIQEPDFASAIKGKKTIASMQDAVGALLANAKIEVDAIARDLREKHTWYIENAADYSFLFSDLQSLIYKDSDSFQAVARNRILTHQEQERAKAEQAAKAQAEREERIRREAEEKARHEEQQRIAAEQAERERLERENKEELERATAKKETPVQAVDKPVKAVAANDAGMEASKLVSDAEMVPVEAEVAPCTFRSKAINMIAEYWEIEYDTAEQWLIQAFSNSPADQQEEA